MSTLDYAQPLSTRPRELGTVSLVASAIASIPTLVIGFNIAVFAGIALPMEVLSVSCMVIGPVTGIIGVCSPGAGRRRALAGLLVNIVNLAALAILIFCAMSEL